MADDDAPPVEPSSRWRRVAKWAAIVIGAVVALVALLLAALNSDPGRRFLVDRLEAIETASGLSFDIGRIDGSLYGELVIRDLRISDPKGVFAVVPRLELDWRPFAYVNNHIDIRSLEAETVRLLRLPALRPVPSDPNAPLLPNIDADIGRLRVDRLILEPAVTGTRRVASLSGRASIADGRAQVALDAQARDGGDRLALRLDAVPEQDRLVLDARLRAPAGGIIASLAGLEAPLTVEISGRGAWSNWRGRAQAVLGGQGLANLVIEGRDGAFTVRGPTRPGLLLAGPVERLTAPNLFVNLTAALNERRADTKLSLRSEALAVTANGLIDLGESRFGGLRVEARLLRPGAIAEDLNGRDVRLALLLDGPFATPVVQYQLQAGALGFGDTVVQGLRAQGRARVNAERITIPVSARAARITGLNAAAGGLLTNVAIDGSLAISGTTILSDNLRIRSDRINATAIVVADLSTGVYRGALKGQVNDYLIDGVGIINLETDVELVSRADGFGLQGRFAARTVRIDNATAAGLLGGPALITGRVSYDPQGVFSVEQLRVAAPDLRISSGSGSYRPDGRIAFRATGTSDRYGPVAVRISGTTERPTIRVRAERPNLGIQLRGVDAVVSGTARGYEVEATGESAYGPFVADVLIRSGRGPLAIDVGRLRFAGIDFSGSVVQTAAGPFAGTLRLAGSGIAGTVQLGAEGSVQRAQVSARANGARIPGDVPIAIERAFVEATLVLYPNAPLVLADLQAAGVRQRALLIRTARARVNYRGGRGTAQLVAEGRSGQPFRVAANAALAPDLYRVAARGRYGATEFRLAEPAVVRATGDGYLLQPTTMVLPQGQIRLAGRYGDGLQIQSRFRNLDLAIVNAFAPGAGIGGRATGSLDFVQPDPGAFPRAEARLLIDNFTRSGAATVSAPVDATLVGTLVPQRGELRGVVRRGGGVIGRIQARLQPVGPGPSWTERLFAAPLAGGVRYNGPADVLWSLTGIADQQLSGPIGVAADFSGRVARPQLTGVVRANSLTYDNETYGTRISNLALTGRFTNDRLEITRFGGRAGAGTVSGRGSIGLSSASGFPIDLRLALDRARLARSDALGATVTGQLAVTNSLADGALIRGDLRLPEARYRIIRQGAAEIAELEGVRRKSAQPLALARPEERAALPGLFRLDIRLRADNALYVSGMGLESEWAADLRVTGTSASPAIVGRVDLVRGTYGFAGREFDLDENSIIRFGGGTNPTLAISATSEVEDVDITLNISGRAENPQIAFTSTPQLPQDELLSRLLFGSSVTELSAVQAIQLAASLNSLRGGGGGLNPLGKLRSATGIDRLRILGADEATGRGTAIAAGQYISNDIYIEIVTDARGFTATQLEIALSESLSLLSAAGSFGGSSLNLRYSKDY